MGAVCGSELRLPRFSSVQPVHQSPQRPRTRFRVDVVDAVDVVDFWTRWTDPLFISAFQLFSLSAFLHPSNAALELAFHALARELHAAAVPGKDPLEVEVEEAFHRLRLLAP